MIVYHGTIADNLKSILKNGLLCSKGGRNWTVSGYALYFWSPRRLEERGEADEGEGEKRAKEYASQSAEFGLAKARNCRRIILELEIPDDDLLDDSSCPGMTGAVCTTRDVHPSEIRKIWIDKDDLSSFKLYFLAARSDRDIAVPLELSHLEKLMVKMARGETDFLCEAMDLLREEVENMRLILSR